MTYGLDTDFLVNLAIAGAHRHAESQRFLARVSSEGRVRFGLTQQVIWEFLHVVTDPRRFERPLAMGAAQTLATQLWEAREVQPIHPAPGLVRRVLALMDELQLGRKRILDTALAATYEAAGITRLVTFNSRDYAVFPFLEAVVPE
ncbi:MAG TPA: PIN domain-containing protein [Thermoanaerobaculia bacterium]|nr:PIN domain-containing protein [Thermoanaerobaculia bacterium]